MNPYVKSWKSSLAGTITLALAGFAAWRNPALIADPGFLGMVTVGAGLIATQDAKQPAPAAKGTDPNAAPDTAAK